MAWSDAAREAAKLARQTAAARASKLPAKISPDVRARWESAYRAEHIAGVRSSIAEHGNDSALTRAKQAVARQKAAAAYSRVGTKAADRYAKDYKTLAESAARKSEAHMAALHGDKGKGA